MSTVAVTVIVQEAGVEVGRMEITYYAGQPYTVRIVTPDGIDAQRERVAEVALEDR